MALRTEFENAGKPEHISDHLALHKLFNANADYYPEVYGAVGDGTTDDTAAIQAAINAAGAAGGGIVRLNQSYNIAPATDFDFGIYTNYLVGLHVNYSNVYLVGPGTIYMRTLPSLGGTKRLGIVMFGNGGTETTQPPLEAGTWIENTGIIGVNFDFTEHTKLELLAISTLGGTTIGFMYCRNFVCSRNVLNHAYSRGGYGAILTLVTCKFADISDNIILGCSNVAMWLDGARGHTVSNNKIIGEAHGVTLGIASAGIVFENNTDNDGSADDNTITGNVIINPKGIGLTISGINNVVTGNRLSTIHGGDPLLYLKVRQTGADYPNTSNVITGNLFRRVAGGSANTAVVFAGITDGAQGGPIKVTEALFANNVINDKWSIGIDLQEQAQDNWIINNVNQAATPIQSDVTATGNVTEPNY